MQNLEILDVFDFWITQKLLKCPKDPFVKSALICFEMVLWSTQSFNMLKLMGKKIFTILCSKVLCGPLQSFPNTVVFLIGGSLLMHFQLVPTVFFSIK